MILIVNKIFYGLGWLTVISSALVSHTILPIPPAFIIFVFVLLNMLVIVFTMKKYRTIPTYSFIVMPFALFVSFTQLLTDAAIKNSVGPVISALYFMVTIYYLNYLTKEQIAKIVYTLMVISVFVLFFETFYRYLFPSYEIASVAGNREGEAGMFYMFKSSSLMYTDSNGAAIHMLIVLFFTYYWGEVVKRKFTIIKLILILLIGLTISRAAWLGCFVGLVYFYFLRRKSVVFWLTFGFILMIVLLLVLFVYIAPIIQEDASFTSKFQIADHVIQYFNKSPSFKDLLIGIGVYQSKELFGIYVHSFLVVQLIEMGFISLFMLFFMWILFDKYSKGKFKIILLPFFLTTLSSTLSFMPVFYVTIAIMCLIETRFKNEYSVYRSFTGK